MFKVPSSRPGMLNRLLSAGLRGVTAVAALAAFALTVSAQVPKPTVQLTSSLYAVDESAGSVRVSVSRLGDATVPFSVTLTASDTGDPATGAVSGQDYIARTVTLDFKPNEFQKTVDIFILDNSTTNVDKFFNLQLSGVTSQAILGAPSSAQVQIKDDESGITGFSSGTIEFSSSYYYGTDSEGADGRGDFYPGAKEKDNPAGIIVTVVRKGGSRGAVLVDYDTVPAPQTWIGPQATEFKQYIPVHGTLELQDYQMSAKFVIPTLKYTNFFQDVFQNLLCLNITNFDTNTGQPIFSVDSFCDTNTTDWIFPFLVFATNANNFSIFQFYPTNGFFQLTDGSIFGGEISPTFNFNVQLSNVRPHPSEDPDVVKPSLGSVNTADVGIVWVDNHKAVDGTIFANLGTGFSFERAHYYTDETRHNYTLMVNRDARVLGSTFVRYQVNNANGGDSPGDHNFHQFPLHPASDYAHPFVDYLPPGTQPWGDATGNTNNFDGIINWGINEYSPKPAIIPINNDNLVEFSEDMIVQLFLFNTEIQPLGPSPAAPALPPFSLAPTRAILTINFDDIYDWAQTTNGWVGAEQPAGAADRRYNRDNEPYTADQPLNPRPGANNSVLATAVQADGRLIVGGEFTAVNTVPLLHLARMTPEGQVDHTFNIGTGTDAAVTAIAIQPTDGKAIIGGPFTSYSGVLRGGLARLNTDGTLDPTFNPGLGANGPVNAIAVLPDGKILVGGEFTSFNGNPANYLIRLNADGSVDTSFNPGTGPNDAIYSIATTSGQKLIELNDRLVDRVAQRSDTYDVGSTEGSIIVEYNLGGAPDKLEILRDGAVIGSVGPATGAGSFTVTLAPGGTSYITVALNRAQALQSYSADWSYKLTINPATDGRPVIGGRFTSFDGTLRNRIARLNTDGSLDTTFNPGFAAEDGVVYSVVKHGRKTYAAGTFTFFDRVSRGRIVGLNENGSVDQNFDPGSGFNDIVYSLMVDSSGKAVAGGLFTQFNNSRRLGMARLKHNGKLDTSFMDTAYNHFAGLPNEFSWEPENFVRTMSFLRTTNSYSITVTNVDAANNTNVFTQTFDHFEDQIFIGGSFRNVGGGFTRDDIRPRNNFARVIGGYTEGPGTLELQRDTYSADEDQGAVFITTSRDDGHLGAATANFNTSDLDQGPGAATARADYLPTATTAIWNTAYDRSRQRSEAYRGPNTEEYFVSYQQPGSTLFDAVRSIFVPILDDTIKEGDEQLQLNLTANSTIMTLGGEPIPTWPATGRSTARLTIVDNDFSPGVIGFSDAQYFVSESGKFATITLTRTNGSVGVVSVDYRTKTGGTASPWDPNTRVGDYDPTIGTISFGAGQTNASFTIPIRDDTTAELDETVLLGLSNPTGGATLGRTSATLTIVDNDFAAGRVGFPTNSVSIDEGAGVATITIQRVGGSLGSSQVTLSTTDGTAHNGIDYVGLTNVTLKWSSGDISDRTVTVPIIDQNTVDGARSFKVVLSNPLVNNAPEPAALGNVKEIAVNIIDNDAFGNLRFSQTGYTVDENGTNAIITVVRANGLVGDMSVNYSAVPQLAIAGQDFTPVSGTLTLTNGQRAASFIVPIIDDNVVDGNKTVVLNLSSQTNNLSVAPVPGVLGDPSANVLLTIIDNELENIPAGSLDASFLAEGANDFIYTVALQKDDRLLIGGDFTTVNSVLRNRLARLFPDGTLDSTFFAGTGPNGSVRSLQLQDDGRILISGAFTQVAGTNRNYIARLLANGNIDQTFDPGAGANNPIYSMLLQADGKIVIGGNFSAYGPTPRNGIARLNQTGTLDTTFDPGTGAAGQSSATVYAIAQQLDGKLLIGGDFTTFNARPANRLVRLNTDGSVDTTFNTSAGANDSVRSLAVQPDGQILVGGVFTTIQGQPANSIARLNTDGTVDASFNANATVAQSKRGANGPVLAISVQIDGKIILGGDFAAYNGVTRRSITRLNPDGSNDPSINFGNGANGSVAALAIQPDRKIILAGGFTEYDGQARLRLARINGGSIAGQGRFEFTRASFVANESGTNVVITVHRIGGTSGSVTMNYSTQPDPTAPADGAATPNMDYTPVSGSLVFPEGETQASFKVPIIDDTLVENEESFDVTLTDPNGGVTRLGDQPTSRVTIVSDDNEIYFTAPSYSVGESIPSGNATITIARAGSVSVQASVQLRTSDGTATAGADYVGQTNTITFAVGESQRTISIGIIPDQLVEGNEYLNLILSNPSTGASIRAGAGTAHLTIVDDDFAPGQIQFQRATYSVREANTVAQVAVLRTNGLSGTVTVQFATQGVTATPGQDYTDVSGILTFNDGESLKFINVPIFDDQFIENNETINLTLSNISGGATLGLAAATLTIVDDDLGSGSVDTDFDPGVGANAPIRAIQYDGNNHYIVGGDFTAYNTDTNRNRIARLQLTGSVDTTFSTNNRPNGGVASLALQTDGGILMGGSFNTVQGQNENRVARLQAEGALDTSFYLPLGLNAQVSALAVQTDGKVIIGGVFSSASAAQRNHIARLNSNGMVDISFDPGTGADRDVNTVALQGNKVLIGGAFGTVNGIGAGRIARLNADGSVDTTFRTGTGFNRADGKAPVVYEIVVLASGRILVAGDFTSYNGTPRAGIAMLDSNGTLQSFGSSLNSVNGAIRTLAIQHTDRNSDEKIIIGGDFTSVDGTARGRVARLDATGAFDPSLDPGDGANDSVLGLYVQPWDGRIVVVGAFTEFNNNPNFHGIARLNNDKAFLPPVVNTPISFGNTTLDSAGGLNITFSSDLGANYAIQGTSDFVTWTDVSTVASGGSTTTTQLPTTGNYRFFRIRKL